ncbi:phage baseplate assembly protein V [Pelomonas sp. BJYL3]|uniref:phage baseplate assembly protein V n=1 Tax=Pelomonas sp. BJYL3 TaxID=2976697 RepID=UPI0022B34F4C|nr:phage baseplate assembly protein V [Pelomonas sp. BJYL3]
METPHVSELIRRIENLLRLGTIARVNAKGYRVRVTAGGLVSNWLPWVALRAGTTRKWSPPTVGEQCLLLSPGGDLVNGVVLVGIFSAEVPPNDNRANTEATHYPDGTYHEYDHEAHRDLLRCVGDVLRQVEGSITHEAKGAITHQADGSILIESKASITLKVGDSRIVLTPSGITADPDIVGGGHVSLVNHKHTKVSLGNDVSGKPL